MSAISKTLNLDFKRIQFTPDLMPADLTGTLILSEDSEGKKDFTFKFKNGKHVGFYKQYSRKNGSVSIEKIDGNTEFGW